MLISEDSRGVLSDFGLSRIQEQLAAGATPSNRPNGTPRYMSPELADGTSSRCREGDVWAWGCLLYYASVVSNASLKATDNWYIDRS